MTDYEKGFLEGLQKAIAIGDLHWHRHFKNAQNEAVSADDREQAFNCTAVIGFFISDLKCLGASIHRGDKTAQDETVTEKRLWWSNEDGKGTN